MIVVFNHNCGEGVTGSFQRRLDVIPAVLQCPWCHVEGAKPVDSYDDKVYFSEIKDPEKF